MSAVRRASRSGARPSPYARPPSKKSSWSISSILSYLNPLKSRVCEEIPIVAEDADESDYNPEEHGQSPAEALSTRGHQLSRKLKTQTLDSQNPSLPTRQTLGNPLPPPSVAQQPEANQDLFVEPTSVSQGIDIVTSFLDSHRDRQISSIEAEGLISLLKKSTAETREPFRFSSSTPSTPQRGNSPLYASTNSTSVPFRFSTPMETPNQISNSTVPKLLKHNPNGTYRWQGGGSAKPRSRNRYQSPAFGSSRATSERLVLKESPEKVKTDTKRRRVGADAETSSASPSGATSTQAHTRSPAPAPSPTRTSQAPPLPTPSVNGIAPDSSRGNGVSGALPSSLGGLRTSAIQKPTTPVVPSPLRQAWGQSSPSTSDGEGSPAPPQKRTKAANFMSELITQVTTSKHLEVSNPYQAASPVKVTGPAKPRSRRIRAGKAKVDVNGAEPEGQARKEAEREKETQKQKEVEKQYSAQAIIEATLPKGSKRSRPPANLSNGSVNGTSRISTSQSPPPSDTHETQPNATGRFAAHIEEVEDEEEKIRIPKKSKPNGHESLANTLKSVPTIEEIAGDELSSSETVTQPSEVIEPGNSIQGKPPFSFSNHGLSSKPGPHIFGMPKSISIPKEPSKLRQSFKADTPPASSTSFPSSSSPSPFSFTAAPLRSSPTVASPQSVLESTSKFDPKQSALDEPVPSLPIFTFTMPTSLSMKEDETMAKIKSAPISSLPKFDFDIPATDSNSSLPTPPSSQPKSEPVKAFDFEAAGLKPAPKLAPGSWICQLCGCSSDASATKCSVCENPR
ncbi:hypothetical protein E1B28_007604 [Marasmius oreades]|uniref:RanBP2-type domain-containing protein n=1 Tax=Marasmius oreades TaxID=181124 RepID=A0A9P7S227_9AGAR|nr:uncharacterized protein E1B28_007604 [Marasmius oreades]KAG7093974.1 hypothetical protein E1B28_007604 [Marasmius oreades]